MSEREDTGFTDKAGKIIKVGDVIQYRLPGGGKSNGTWRYVVEKRGKKIVAVQPHQYGGDTAVNLEKLPAENIVRLGRP